MFNIQTQYLEEMDIARDNFKNDLCCLYFESLSDVLLNFPKLTQIMLDDRLLFPLYSIQKVNNYRRLYIPSFEKNCKSNR